MNDPRSAHKLKALFTLLKSTRQLSARATLYASALGAVVFAGGSYESAALGTFVSAIGVNAISSILDRIGRNELSEEEIREQTLTAIEQSRIASALEDRDVQVMIAKLFHQLDLLNYAIHSNEFDILQRLSEQATKYESFSLDLRGDLSMISSKLDNLATRHQVDQLIALLKAKPQPEITINYITRGLDELPTRYESRIQNFLEYYLGTRNEPAPFGGRASDLASLDTWLRSDDGPPYALLISPAGRGKSALLAHWIEGLVSEGSPSNDNVTIVYFPISIRFNTNLETVVFTSLAARLAHLYGNKVPQITDAQQARGLFGDYIRRAQSLHDRLLVVVDGLDEAAGWEVGADLFPRIPPPNLRVVVAARPLAGDIDEIGWLSRLGWDVPEQAKTFSLTGLERSGVQDVLLQMGNPLNELATKLDVVEKLYDLSEGDPLIVRLYIEALLNKKDHIPQLRPEDLLQLKPGLEPYFDLWFEQQYKLWGERKPIQDRRVRSLLNLCAMALGPLRKDDVLAIAPDIFEDSWVLAEAARPLNRFIIGDGNVTGYVYSHPRLGEYFANKLSTGERRELVARYLKFGHDTLAALEAKTLHPRDASSYVVQYYGAHLVLSHATAASFYAVICEGWLRAWEWMEGTSAGFLIDVRRAWEQAQNEGPAGIGQQIRAALCVSSVASLSAKIDSRLLHLCVRAGVIGLPLALVIARQKGDPSDRAESLLGLMPFISPAKSQSIIRDVLLAARSIGDILERVETLTLVADRMSGEEQEHIFSEAFDTVRTISDEHTKAEVLKKLSFKLPESLFHEAWRQAETLDDDDAKVFVYSRLIPRLPETFLPEAFAAISKIENTEIRGRAFVPLCHRLSVEMARDALVSVRDLTNPQIRARNLGILANRLPMRERTEVLNEALATANLVENPNRRMRLLRELSVQSSGDDGTAKLDNAQTFTLKALDETNIVNDLREIFNGLDANEHAALASRLLTTTDSIRNSAARVRVLILLASHLELNERQVALTKALMVTSAITNESQRANLIIKMAGLLSDDQVGVALNSVWKIDDLVIRSRALSSLAPRLPKNMQAEIVHHILSGIQSLRHKDKRVTVLGVLAAGLADVERKHVINQALAEVDDIGNLNYRIHVLVQLASLLPAVELSPSLIRVLGMVNSLNDERARNRILISLATRLAEPERNRILAVVLDAAKSIGDQSAVVRVLRVKAEKCSESERTPILREAIVAATLITNDFERGEALNYLVWRLPGHLLLEASNACKTIESEEIRLRVLDTIQVRMHSNSEGNVLPRANKYGSSGYKWKALTSANGIGDESTRNEVIRILERGSDDLSVTELSSMISALATVGRRQLLTCTKALLPGIERLGGQFALAEISESIIETAKWWP